MIGKFFKIQFVTNIISLTEIQCLKCTFTGESTIYVDSQDGNNFKEDNSSFDVNRLRDLRYNYKIYINNKAFLERYREHRILITNSVEK